MSPITRKPRFPDPPRQHSAQPGNLNPLQHGFYDYCFSASEVEAIQDLQPGDLRQEIAALRVIARRILQLSLDIDDINTSLRLLSTFSTTTARISRLVKTQSIIEQHNSTDSFENALRQAILEWHAQ